MIIDAMTTAHRNEYFRNLLEHQRLTLESVTKQRDRLAEVIKASTVLIAAKGRHNTMLAYDGLRDALAAVKGGQP